MDPNAALAQLREDIARAKEAPRGGSGCSTREIAIEDMISGFEALDKWISEGGFLPEAWNKGRS